jgi:hypothetical protein
MRYVVALLVLAAAAAWFGFESVVELLLALSGIAALGVLLFALARRELDVGR